MDKESDIEFVERMVKLFKEPMFDDFDPDHEARLFALARRGAEMQWRPIEMAPKDGTHILTFGREGEIGHIMWWADYIRMWRDQIHAFNIPPTHWMPLPPPPAEETE